MKYNVFLIVFLLISFFKLFRSSIIFSDGTDVKNSMVEIHGLETSVPKYIICIGVGTCLSVKNYRRLAERIVNVLPDALTVILDPNPSGRGFFHRIVHPGIIKFRASDFASAFCKASTWIHSSIYSRRKVFEWYVGGHSSSGQGAYAAVTRQYLTEKISGYIGLDPCCIYNIVNEPLLVPSIVWTTSDPFANCVPSIIAGAGFHNRIISSAIGKLHISHSLFRLTGSQDRSYRAQ